MNFITEIIPIKVTATNTPVIIKNYTKYKHDRVVGIYISSFDETLAFAKMGLKIGGEEVLPTDYPAWLINYNAYDKYYDREKHWLKPLNEHAKGSEYEIKFVDIANSNYTVYLKIITTSNDNTVIDYHKRVQVIQESLTKGGSIEINDTINRRYDYVESILVHPTNVNNTKLYKQTLNLSIGSSEIFPLGFETSLIRPTIENSPNKKQHEIMEEGKGSGIRASIIDISTANTVGPPDFFAGGMASPYTLSIILNCLKKAQ